MNLRMGASGVGSKVWVLTIGVLEVNPERDSIRAQRGRARSALFTRVSIIALIDLIAELVISIVSLK